MLKVGIRAAWCQARKCAYSRKCGSLARQVFGIVVRGGGRGAFGVVDERRLKLVGNHPQFVAAHVQQGIHSGLDAYLVGRGNEFAIGDQPHLVSVGNDPLRVGRGEVVPEPQHARAEFGGVGELPRRVFGTQFDGTRRSRAVFRSSPGGRSAGSSRRWSRWNRAGKRAGVGLAPRSTWPRRLSELATTVVTPM